MNRLVFLTLLVFSSTAIAERMQELGEFVVHYNAVTSDFLKPEVAREFGISRSRTSALLSVSVLRKSSTGVASESVEADIAASAVNLTGQQRDIPLRLVTEQDARYYIGSTRVANQETLNFTLSVTLPGESSARELKFTQKFFTQ